MKEKLQTLSLVQLKEIAREQGFKGVSNLNKANLIDLLVEFSENQNKPIAKSEGGSSEVATRENSYQRDNYQSQNGYSNQNNYSSQNNYSNQSGYANQSGYSNQNRNTYHSTQRNNVMNQGRTTGYTIHISKDITISRAIIREIHLIITTIKTSTAISIITSIRISMEAISTGINIKISRVTEMISTISTTDTKGTEITLQI